MHKPRVFIGSSVEGLNIAYAVQQNLLHEAEVTVWDQGVFELSRTTLESLTGALENNDFGVFVFSPDDLVKIRDQTASAVRDNVLFEFGLFIGKLSRERVFFLIPNEGELRLPTDLLGVTPGRYESDRADGSMQAATGAVCHQIRLQVRALGVIPGRASSDAGSEGVIVDKLNERDWISDFVDKKYDEAISKLEKKIDTEEGDRALNLKGWVEYCKLKNGGAGSVDGLIEFAGQHADTPSLLSLIATFLRWEGAVSSAIQILEVAQKTKPKDLTIARALAASHVYAADNASAIAGLTAFGSDESPDIAIELAEAFERDEKQADAFGVLQSCFARHPGHQELKFKLARIAQEIDKHEIAIYLLDALTSEDPKSIEYWGYLGNSCLQLDLYDSALCAYRKAEKLMPAEDSSQWIVANIGNIFANKSFHSEARTYFDRAVKHEPDSEYAHERLARALKETTAEQKKFRKLCSEGGRQLREADKMGIGEPAHPA